MVEPVRRPDWTGKRRLILCPSQLLWGRLAAKVSCYPMQQIVKTYV